MDINENNINQVKTMIKIMVEQVENPDIVFNDNDNLLEVTRDNVSLQLDMKECQLNCTNNDFCQLSLTSLLYTYVMCVFHLLHSTPAVTDDWISIQNTNLDGMKNSVCAQMATMDQIDGNLIPSE
jgi:hypothetical protein